MKSTCCGTTSKSRRRRHRPRRPRRAPPPLPSPFRGPRGMFPPPGGPAFRQATLDVPRPISRWMPRTPPPEPAMSQAPDPPRVPQGPPAPPSTPPALPEPVVGSGFTNLAKDRADAQRLVTTRLLERLHDPLGHISRLQRIYPRAW
jgi:hypothetical protein